MSICRDGDILWFVWMVIQLDVPGSNGGPYEKELLKGLLQGYERQNRQSLF